MLWSQRDPSIVEDANSERMQGRWDSASAIQTWCIGIYKGGGGGVMGLIVPQSHSYRPLLLLPQQHQACSLANGTL